MDAVASAVYSIICDGQCRCLHAFWGNTHNCYMDADRIRRVAVCSCRLGYNGIPADFASNCIEICKGLRCGSGKGVTFYDDIFMEFVAPFSVFGICPVHAYCACTADSIIQNIYIFTCLSFDILFAVLSNLGCGFFGGNVNLNLFLQALGRIGTNRRYLAIFYSYIFTLGNIFI